MKTTSQKIILFLAASAALVCSVVRFFQIVTLTDTETGFFLEGSELGGILIYALLCVSAIMLAAAVFAGKRRGDAAYSLSSGGMGDNATRFLGISEIVGGFLMGLRLLENKDVFFCVVTFAAALSLIFSGIILMGRIIPPPATGHLMLVTAVCMFLRTANFFNSDLTVLNHAENLIVLMAYVAATVFVAFTARFYARIETKNSRVGEVISALLTFLLSATHTLSDLLAVLFGGEAAARFAAVNTDVAAAMLISGTFLAVIFCTVKKKDLVPVVETE